MSVVGFMVVVEIWKLSAIKDGSFISSVLKAFEFILFSFSITFLTSAIERMGLIEGEQNISGSKSQVYGSFIENNTMDDLTIKELKDKVANDDYIVYFGADWCVSCRKMERDIFTNPDYIDSLSDKDISLIKMDVTRNTDNNKSIMNEYNIFGPPALLVFNNGNLVRVKQGEIDLEDANTLLQKHF